MLSECANAAFFVTQKQLKFLSHTRELGPVLRCSDYYLPAASTSERQVRQRNHLTVPACSSTSSPQHWCATCVPFPGITALLTQRSPSQLFKPSPMAAPQVRRAPQYLQSGRWILRIDSKRQIRDLKSHNPRTYVSDIMVSSRRISQEDSDPRGRNR